MAGVRYNFVGWRVQPSGYALPGIVGNFKEGFKTQFLPPEMTFENEDGVQIGVHPSSRLIKFGQLR